MIQSREKELRLSVQLGSTYFILSPRTEAPENAGKLIDEGLSVARLNFSHGDHEEHKVQMNGVQEALKTRPHSHTSILLDTKGP